MNLKKKQHSKSVSIERKRKKSINAKFFVRNKWLIKEILFANFRIFFKWNFREIFELLISQKFRIFFPKQIKAKFSRNDFPQTLSTVHWEPENGEWMLSLFFLLLNVANEIIIYNLCISYILWVADIEINAWSLSWELFCVWYS